MRWLYTGNNKNQPHTPGHGWHFVNGTQVTTYAVRCLGVGNYVAFAYTNGPVSTTYHTTLRAAKAWVMANSVAGGN